MPTRQALAPLREAIKTETNNAKSLRAQASALKPCNTVASQRANHALTERRLQGASHYKDGKWVRTELGRWHRRHQLLAYGYLRGTPYARIEQKVDEGTVLDHLLIAEYAAPYSDLKGGALAEDICDSWLFPEEPEEAQVA